MRPTIHPCALVLLCAISTAARAGESTLQDKVGKLPDAQLATICKSDWLIRRPDAKARVYRNSAATEIILDNGLVRRTFRIRPNGATVGLDNGMTGQTVLRGVKPEAKVEINGHGFAVGGLRGQPNYAYLTDSWIDQLSADPAAMQLVDVHVGRPTKRLEWKRVRHHAANVSWPPSGVALRFDYAMGRRAVAGRLPDELAAVRVSIHYELYDHVPVMSKWLCVHNRGDRTITVNRFTSEILAAVEYASSVESRGLVPQTPNIHVETDFAFGGFTHRNANRHAVRWTVDPDYSTQVSYQRTTPCLLQVGPSIGPEQDVAPGDTFETFRTFLLLYDSTERERKGLSLRRMYRTIAPWVTENPLMMHMRTSRPDAVRQAIDQCAEVGFEMLILSFGSGFNIENDDPQYIRQWRDIADYAAQKDVEIGGYSLLSSRRVGGGNDIVSPPGEKPTHGACPALASPWGQNYFRQLRHFFEQTDFALLEHDGSYPGDVDTTPRPPRQKGALDSRWVQWRIITDFYKWCRARGIYLNVPDYYYPSGSNKCGMGYREVNWSLPRAQQVIHTRQNIYDGTWEKTPSMGWMFVPLTEYHGGGAAATIEPLDQHRDHYRRMLTSNLAMGVQACYRGPRLYDTQATKALVREWVIWFKTYRDILESDIVHGRRADGRGLDWMLHVNPQLRRKGMLVVFNPRDETIETTLNVNLYYTGLTDVAQIRPLGGPPERRPLDRKYSVELPVKVPGGGMSWYVIERR